MIKKIPKYVPPPPVPQPTIVVITPPIIEIPIVREPTPRVLKIPIIEIVPQESIPPTPVDTTERSLPFIPEKPKKKKKEKCFEYIEACCYCLENVNDCRCIV